MILLTEPRPTWGMNAKRTQTTFYMGLVITVMTIVAFMLLSIGAPMSRGATITVTASDCSGLVAHKPNVGVNYVPGVDVDGKAVVSADLNSGPPINLPKMVKIPITVDLASRFGLPSEYLSDNMNVGNAKVQVKDGRAMFNGRPLSSDATHALARACQRGMGKNR